MPALRRALGRWDLTAIGVNQVIGGAIFVWPAQVAAQVGAWAPIGFVLVGVLSLSIALCLAEVSSRFDGTGGPYLHARTAFGDFIGFEVGWMQWFSRSTSQASIMAATVLALGYFWPGVTAGWARAAILIALTMVFASVNVRGIRQSALVVNTLTIGKLLPLAIFIIVGLPYVHADRFTTLPPVGVSRAGAAALLLIFIYGGYEVVPVPAGEALNPRRDVPFAIVATIVISMIVMTLAHVVSQGVLADVAAHSTPLADAAAVFLGAAGGLLIGVGSIVSMSGNNAGQVLNGSRMLFALAEQGQLPRWFGRVHSASQTPVNAIVFTSAVALTLALSESFATIAVVSALARLLMYTGSAAATLRLRAQAFAGSVKPATFVTPFGALIPIVAICVCIGIAFGATRQQLLGGLIALAAGAALYGFQLQAFRAAHRAAVSPGAARSESG